MSQYSERVVTRKLIVFRQASSSNGTSAKALGQFDSRDSLRVVRKSKIFVITKELCSFERLRPIRACSAWLARLPMVVSLPLVRVAHERVVGVRRAPSPFHPSGPAVGSLSASNSWQRVSEHRRSAGSVQIRATDTRLRSVTQSTSSASARADASAGSADAGCPLAD